MSAIIRHQRCVGHPEDPKAQPIIGFFFLLFLIGATLQVIRLRSLPRPA